MNPFGGIVKNTVVILIGSVVRMVSSFVLVVLVARYLGKTGMGEFSFLVSLFWLFQSIALLGLQPLITREVAKDLTHTNAFLVNSIWIGGVSALVMMGVMVLYVVIAGYSDTLQTASFYMSTALLWTTLSLVFQSVFIAHGRTELILWATAVENVLKLVLGLWALEAGKGIVLLSVIMGIAPLINLIMNVFSYVHNFGGIRLVFDKIVFKWMLKLVPTFAGISIFNSLFANVDILLLSKLKSMEEVGIYGAALRMVAVIRMILQSYKAAVQPAAAQTFESSNADFKRFCTKSLRYILLITIPIALGTTALADRLIALLFGPQFADAGPVLVLLIWTLIPYGGMLVFASFLISSNNQHVDLRINAVSTVTATVFCLLLIPPLGAKGAALAVLISMTLFLVQQIVFVQRHLFRVDWVHIGWKIITAGLLMGLAIGIGWLPLALEIIAGGAVYCLILIALKEPTILEFRKFRFNGSLSKGAE